MPYLADAFVQRVLQRPPAVAGKQTQVNSLQDYNANHCTTHTHMEKEKERERERESEKRGKQKRKKVVTILVY